MKCVSCGESRDDPPPGSVEEPECNTPNKHRWQCACGDSVTIDTAYSHRRCYLIP